VAQVEDHPLAFLALVRGDDPRLDLAGTADRMLECRRVARQNAIGMIFEPGIERRIRDERGLERASKEMSNNYQ
jgi:hypothetical protein